MNKKFEKLINILQNKNLNISSCESITGGMFANEITNIPDASKVYLGSFVCYSNNFKTNIVKVDKQIIKKYGVVSKECAVNLAFNTKVILNTDISISFTGNAGPNSLENKRIGLAYVGIYYNNQNYVFTFKKDKLNRIEFKKQLIDFGVTKLLELI